MDDRLPAVSRSRRSHHPGHSAFYLALPLEDYAQIETWGAANDAWIEVAQEIGGAAMNDALGRANLEPTDVDALLFVSVTGVATPSIDARLINRLGLSPNIKRMPIFGLGCVAGAAGIARAADYVRAFPDQVAVLLSVELCSLTLQLQDFSVANLISSGLFGDGAAAVVVTGDKLDSDGPRILATRSVFYPDSERVMGWDVSEKGFQVVLSPEVPQVVRQHLRHDIEAFLADQGVAPDRIASWVAHPGGPKILQAIEESLDLQPHDLELTWKSLRSVGNLSSTSVLMVLADTIENRRPEPGSLGLLFALDAAICRDSR